MLEYCSWSYFGTNINYFDWIDPQYELYMKYILYSTADYTKPMRRYILAHDYSEPSQVYIGPIANGAD